MRQFYTAVLNRLGHRVVGAAADGQQLVDICLREPVDFVITDIKMPTMSGVDAARAITERIPLPFLFVSAYHDDELIAGASMRFGYGYLVKPIKQEDLSTSIPIAVRRFRVQES